MNIDELAHLNSYAVEVRYADDWREPDIADARAALVLALEIRNSVSRLLPSTEP
jgi:hypothetical protein